MDLTARLFSLIESFTAFLCAVSESKLSTSASAGLIKSNKSVGTASFSTDTIFGSKDFASALSKIIFNISPSCSYFKEDTGRLLVSNFIRIFSLASKFLSNGLEFSPNKTLTQFFVRSLKLSESMCDFFPAFKKV